MERALELRDQILRGDIVAGILPPDKFDEMVELFTEAGEDGNAEAWWELGRALATGLNTFAPDPERAVLAWERAWDGGMGREVGLAIVQTSYFACLDVLPPIKIRSILEELMESDEDGAARLLVGWMHYAGYLFEEDVEQAVALHESAAERGNADAMFELSVLIGNGEGAARDPKASHDWCVKAAEAGNARAMYNLGAAYATGTMVQQDEGLALAWYERAAKNGHGRAAATASYMYSFGQGGKVDFTKAENYFNLASELGYDPNLLWDAMDIEPPFLD